MVREYGGRVVDVQNVQIRVMLEVCTHEQLTNNITFLASRSASVVL